MTAEQPLHRGLYCGGLLALLETAQRHPDRFDKSGRRHHGCRKSSLPWFSVCGVGLPSLDVLPLVVGRKRFSRGWTKSASRYRNCVALPHWALTKRRSVWHSRTSKFGGARSWSRSRRRTP